MADNRLDVIVRGEDELSPQLKKIESSVIRAVGAISAAIATIKIGSAPIIAAAQFEKEMADVAKTTDFARASIQGGIGDLDRLSESLLKMSLRVNIAAVDLAKIAAAAGQLGFAERFGVDGVIQFTDSVSRMAAVLDLSAEESATNLGKIINIFKTPIRDIEKAISIVNEVSNKSTASGKELLDVIKRIGDAAGSLNLEQAAALSATGIDFGLSPEVVGTAFSKAFSAMREDADKFAKVVKDVALESGEVLTGSAKQWIEVVEKDGIAALKAYLTGLRKLDVQSQQIAIVKLVGGGRIGALFNKLVQDASDSILDNSLKAAKEGALGVSALKEQAQVMFTLSSQATILQNSLFKLGVEASQSSLLPLTQMVAKLSAALQTPEMMSFVNAAVAGITDLVKIVGSLVGFVSNLNVNWENFVQVLKYFLLLKAGEALGGLLTRIQFFGVSLKSIARNASDAADATKKLGTAAQQAAAAEQAAAATSLKGWLQRATGFDQLLQKQSAYKAAVEASRAAEENAAKGRTIAGAAKSSYLKTEVVTDRTSVAAKQAQEAVLQQQAVVNAATQRAADAAVAAQATKAARIEVTERESAARRLVIQKDYEDKYTAIKATGTQVGLKKLRADTAALLAEEEASHQRSLRGIETYYGRRAALQQTALNAEILRETQKLAVLNEAGVIAASAGAAGATAAANAAAAAAASDAQKKALETQAKNADEALKKAKSGVLSFGAVLSIVGGVISRVAGLLFNAFFWVTIIHSILDAVGAMDKLWPVLQKVGDFFGLSSKAARDNKIAIEEAAKAAQKAAADYEVLAQRYKKFVDASTGSVDAKKLEDTAKGASQSVDLEGQRKQVSDLLGVISGGQAIIKEAEVAAASATADKIATATASVKEAEAALKRITDERDRALSLKRPLVSEEAVNSKYIAQIAEAKKNLEEATKALKTYSATQASAAAVIANTGNGVEKATSLIGKFVSADVARQAVGLLEPLQKIRAEMDANKDSSEKAQKAFAEARGDARKAAEDRLTFEIDEKLRLGAAEKGLLDALNAYIDKQKTMPGIPDGVLTQWESLRRTILTITNADLGTFLSILKSADPKVLTGTTPLAPPPKKSGNDTVSFRGESKKDRANSLQRARFALAKATAEAERRELDENNKQTLEIEQRRYDQGLVAAEEFYKKRLDALVDANEADIRLKKMERDAAIFERDIAAKDKKEPERLRFEADVVRANSEIRVLEAQKNAIKADIEESTRKDAVNFNKDALNQINALFREGIISDDSQQIFQSNLNEFYLSFGETMAKLRKEGKGAIADALEVRGRGEAFQNALAPLNSLIDTASTKLDNLQSRLSRARNDGSLTAAEFDAANTRAIEDQLPLMESLLAKQVALLDIQRQTGEVSAAVYAKQLLDIDATRLKIEDLRNSQNAMARDLNASIRGSVTTALDDLLRFGSSVSGVFTALLSDVAGSIRKVLVDDLSGALTRSLGLTGEGGIGGAVMGLLGKATGITPQAPAGGIAGTAQATAQAANTTALGVSTTALGAFTTALGAAAGAAGASGATGLISEAVPSIVGGAPAVAGLATDALGASTEAAIMAANTAAQTANTVAVGASTAAFAPLTLALGSLPLPLGSLGASAAGLLAPLGLLAMSLEVATAAVSTFAATTSAKSMVGLLHSGGIVGKTQLVRKAINPAVFFNAPRYHGGGTAGLRPNEVPAILEKGEQVLTENQQSLVSAAMSTKGSAAPMNIRNVLVTDPNFVPDAMSSTQGEKVLMTFVQRNRASIRQLLS